MKAFTFRLEQALRWRAAQVDIEKAKLGAAVNTLAQIRAQIAQREGDLKAQATALTAASPDGSTLAAWSSWQSRTQTTIQKLRAEQPQAEAALTEQMTRLTEANRQWQLIENLKTARKAKWTEDFAGELESFAAESFLGRLQSKRKGA